MTTAVLWTGGKDSALALHLVQKQAREVRELVTFVPPEADFKAHDLRLMAAQARAVGLPHRRVVIEPPYELGYERALLALKESGIQCVVTGDLAEVGGQPNFITACAERAGLAVELPLWGAPRAAHLEQLLACGFELIFTYVNEPWLDAAWVGRRLDAAALGDLRRLAREKGLDLAGENGEYHSMVLAGPGWQGALLLEGVVRSAPPVHRLEITLIHEISRHRLEPGT